MGTTFVTVDGERGFWMRDSVLELWLRLLALHIEDPIDSGSVATQIRNQWLVASRGYFNGCVPVDLEEAVATEDGEALVLSAIHSLLKALEAGPPTINKDALNLLGFSDAGWTQDFEARRLVETGHAFLDLIDGKITGTARDTAFMPGSH